jgi:DNA-binding MarR family transcriptional regulator
MTVAQAATLEALAQMGSMRLGDLGRRLGITPSTLTRNLARLEDGKLVSRVEDPDDRRASRVGLTGAGERAAASLRKQDEAFAGAILDALPADRREAVAAGLAELLVAVRRATEGCCPGAFDHLMEDFPRDGRRERGEESEDERADCGC